MMPTGNAANILFKFLLNYNLLKIGLFLLYIEETFQDFFFE